MVPRTDGPRRPEPAVLAHHRLEFVSVRLNGCGTAMPMRPGAPVPFLTRCLGAVLRAGGSVARVEVRIGAEDAGVHHLTDLLHALPPPPRPKHPGPRSPATDTPRPAASGWGSALEVMLQSCVPYLGPFCVECVMGDAGKVLLGVCRWGARRLLSQTAEK